MVIDLKLEGKEIVKSVCDLFSPLTELAGTIGDKLRIYRQISVLRALKRAKEISDEEGLVLEAPPLKFLIPYLESSSLEDPEDEILIELWARLLASSATDYKGEYSLYIRILNELSPNEAKAFNYIADFSEHELYEGYRYHIDIESDWSDASLYIAVRDLIKKYEGKDYTKIDYREFEKKLKSKHQPPGTIIYWFSVASGSKNKYPYEGVYDGERTEFDDLFEPISFSILKSIGLIGEFVSPEYWFGNVCIELRAYYFTSLGAGFYEACIGKRNN